MNMVLNGVYFSKSPYARQLSGKATAVFLKAVREKIKNKIKRIR